MLGVLREEEVPRPGAAWVLCWKLISSRFPPGVGRGVSEEAPALLGRVS